MRRLMHVVAYDCDPNPHSLDAFPSLPRGFCRIPGQIEGDFHETRSGARSLVDSVFGWRDGRPELADLLPWRHSARGRLSTSSGNIRSDLGPHLKIASDIEHQGGRRKDI